MIVQLRVIPPGWAIGLDELGGVSVIHHFEAAGWFNALWFNRETGEEHCSSVLDPQAVPDGVRMIARLLQHELGRPCPWEKEGATA